MKNNTPIFKIIENQTIVWFDNNKYIVLENTTADILKNLNNGISAEDIAENLSKKMGIPLEKTIDFILNLEKNINNEKNIVNAHTSKEYRDVRIPNNYNFIKFYKVNDVVLKVSFLSETELTLIHPKFEHLVVNDTNTFNDEFETFIQNNYIFLFVNKKFIGSWNKDEVHYFQGKFSMELVQKIHQKNEENWLGAFHASALSNGKKSILFLGDSGNGKSTSLAILQANGYTCLADDFVPVDAKKQEVYSFPAAISIKKNSLETLTSIYPELKSSSEYNFKRLNKVVRYLKPNNTDFLAHLPCNDLVFIKYKKDSKLEFEKISKINAFQQLVPDSWLSPIKENAEIFLDWFVGLNCYQLTYSNNDEMISTVSKIFNNDL